MLSVIAVLIVWAIIQALCNKNPGPLLVVFILYAILSLIGELVY